MFIKPNHGLGSGFFRQKALKRRVHFINSPTENFQYILRKRIVKKTMVYPGFEPIPLRLRVKHRHTKLPGCPALMHSFISTRNSFLSIFSK
jgi:hypothetical protein